ncbi:MAG: NAD(P)H-dependent glycerol-3-phosphate dehydrogenase [Bacillota bacterium]|nr:MAG: glycerol-3-phosphate dehydrogenase [Bacillota bacterium]
MEIAILPAGVWGTALAVPASAAGNRVRLWRRTPGWSAGWDRGHPALPGLRLPDAVAACDSPADAVSGADLVILSPASAGLRAVCRLVRPHLRPDAVIVTVTKSIEPETHLLVHQVVGEELPEHRERIVALSGPNFAHEVAAGLPTGAVAACPDLTLADQVQAALMTDRFRIYTNPDLVGVELAAALKNVIALGVGISDGLGMGDNARAALITRGLVEMARLGRAMGANPLTFAGLAGLGDLVLSCTGDSSRNRRAGLAIGRGQSAAEFLAETGLTVEGIPTTRAAWQLARRLGVRMPITEAIYQVLYEGLAPLTAMERLMARPRAHELEEVAEADLGPPKAR